MLWAQGLNTLLPWRAGDWARAYGIRRACQGSAAYALGTIAAEKLLDLACLAAAALLLLHFQKLPDPAVLQPTWRMWAPFLLLGGALVLAWSLGRAASHRSQDWPGQWRAVIGSGQKLVAGLTMLARPAVLAPALACSALLWVSHAFNNYATAKALAVPMDWPGALLVLVVLQVGLAPPSTPAKIGVFQALCVASLGLLGQSAAVGLAYGLALQLVVMLPPLALLLVDLTLKELRGQGRPR
jgi:hypothetical protein